MLSILALVLTPAAPGPPGSPGLAAQERVVERQLPVDSARGIEAVGPALRDQLGLFEEVEGFVEARLFEVDGERTVLEISFRRDGELLRERRYLEPSVLESLRAHLVRRIAERDAPGDANTRDGENAPDDEAAEIAAAPAPESAAETPDEDTGAGVDADADTDVGAEVARVAAPGRRGMLLGHTLLGAGFHGWALPKVLGLDGDRERVGAHLLTTGLSFLAPYLLTRDAAVGPVHRHGTLWGGSRGIVYGLLAASAIEGDDTYDDRGHLTAGLAGGVAGSVLGYLTVDAMALDEGTALLWTTLTDIGTIGGVGTAYAAGLYDQRTNLRFVRGRGGRGPWIVPEEVPAHPHASHAAVLATTGLGLAAGRWLGRRDSFTPGDVYALRSAVLLGAQLALPLAEVTVDADGDRGKRYAAGAVVGGALGVIAGAEAIRGLSLDRDDGLLLNVGQLAGSIGALGVSWFLAGEDDGKEQLYTGSAAFGSIVGLAVAARVVAEREARNGARSSAGDAPSRSSREGARIELSPAAALAGVVGPAGRESPPPTLLRIRF